jgi:imidazolonepropionase-like amidohydrolase
MGKLLLILLALCAFPLSAADPEAQPESILLLRGARIIDLEAAALTAPMDVLIEERSIVAVAPRVEVDLPPERVLDLGGRFLLPGLIEMHGHVLLHPWLPDGSIARQYDREAVLQNLRTLLAFGITTLRDPGSPTEAAVTFRQLIRDGKVTGPELYTAGRILNASAFPYEPFVEVRTVEEVQREIRWQAAAGVDFVKVYGTLPPDLVRAAVEEARKQGLDVTGHLTRTSWSAAAAIGIAGVEHPADWSAEHLPPEERKHLQGGLRARTEWLNRIDPEGEVMQALAADLAAAGTYVVPTLVTVHSKAFGNDPRYIDPEERDLVPEIYWKGWEKGSFTADWSAEDYERAQASYPRLPRLIRTLHDAGVLLAVGTDMPTPWTIPGVSFHQELLLLSETGLSNAKILAMATINGARAMGFDHRLGRIAPGYEADLVVLTADPLVDLANTRAIELVISDGVAFTPDSLLRGMGTPTVQ